LLSLGVPKIEVKDDCNGEPCPAAAAAAATAALLLMMGAHEPRVVKDDACGERMVERGGERWGDEVLVAGATLAMYRGLPIATRELHGWVVSRDWESRGLKS